MGFNDKRLKWIRFSISKVKFSVLINTPLLVFSSPHKGIRQGDPLSPFLFILAMESLSKVLDNNSGLRVSMLALILGLNLTLQLFEALSGALPGLHINMLKSIIYPVNGEHNIEMLADITGCSIGSLPLTYLGLPMGGNFKNSDVWNGVGVEKRPATLQCNICLWGAQQPIVYRASWHTYLVFLKLVILIPYLLISCLCFQFPRRC